MSNEITKIVGVGSGNKKLDIMLSDGDPAVFITLDGFPVIDGVPSRIIGIQHHTNNTQLMDSAGYFEPELYAGNIQGFTPILGGNEGIFVYRTFRNSNY